jgi:hypothetical protein
MSADFLALLTAFASEIGLTSNEAFLHSKEITVKGVTVSFLYQGNDRVGDVILYSALGDIAEARQAIVLRNAMQANYLGVATGGATLGLGGDTLALSLRIPLALLTTAQILCAVVKNFVDIASVWQNYANGSFEFEKNDATDTALAFSSLTKA